MHPVDLQKILEQLTAVLLPAIREALQGLPALAEFRDEGEVLGYQRSSKLVVLLCRLLGRVFFIDPTYLHCLECHVPPLQHQQQQW